MSSEAEEHFEPFLPVLQKASQPPTDTAVPVAVTPEETEPSLPFAVVPIPGKGHGCRAVRDIECGERLIAESPLVQTGPGLPPLKHSPLNP